MAKAKVIKCKKCGNSFEIGSKEDKETRNKEWPMTAPMPDKEGNITITLMATWKCGNCGKTIRGSAGKTKGEFKGKSKKEKIDDIIESREEFSLPEFAEELGVKQDNLEQILNVMMKKGLAKGKIEDDKFIPS